MTVLGFCDKDAVLNLSRTEAERWRFRQKVSTWGWRMGER